MNDFNIIDQQQSLFDAISNLDFSIPIEVFLAFDSLTNFVGYIMPLRLYLPIILLILSYWFILIVSNAFRMGLSFIGTVASFAGRFFK